MNKSALVYKGGLWVMNNIVNINQAATQAAATPATPVTPPEIGRVV